MFLKNTINIFRSVAFNILFFSTVISFMLFGVFLIPANQRIIYRFWYYLSLSIDFLAQKIMGITYTVKGLDNKLDIPVIYAVRHESAWETLVPVHFFQEPIFLIKKELAEIPIFGILAKKAGAIPIDREEGVKTLMDALKSVQEKIAGGHPIIMFPEGTRVHPGEHVELKRGIALFYSRAKCPVVPVVHNSGTCWSRRSFLKKSGNITIKFLPPIEPGLSKEEFIKQLNEAFHEGIEELKH